MEVSRHQTDSLIKQLNIRVRHMGPILSFLNALNDPNFDKTIPVTVPSKLPVGGNIKN